MISHLEELVVLRDNVVLLEDEDGPACGVQVGEVQIVSLAINSERKVGMGVPVKVL